MTDTYDPELIKRYEEEIDNSKSFIEKAVIASFTFYKPSKLKAIETYYIALIARDLERFVDHLILLQKADSHLIKQTLEVIDHMKVMISSLNPDDPRAGFSHAECMKLIKKIIALGKIDIKDIDSYHRNRVKAQLFSISEVLMDWAITQEIAD